MNKYNRDFTKKLPFKNIIIAENGFDFYEAKNV
jgi:hypothetical protein